MPESCSNGRVLTSRFIFGQSITLLSIGCDWQQSRTRHFSDNAVALNGPVL